jgi:hypothetical protein
LFRRGKSIDERDKQDYFTPSSELFYDYCQRCVGKYDLRNLVHQSDVRSLLWKEQGADDRPDRCWVVETSTGMQLARVVVLALGPGTPNAIPISSQENEGACHSSQIPVRGPVPDHVRQKMRNKKPSYAMVVGGGLTSAQIAHLCIGKGYSKVFHVMRSRLKIKHFDLQLQWIAKYKNLELAYFWGETDPETRSRVIESARDGGSITPAYIKVLEDHISRGKLSMSTQTNVTQKIWNPPEKTWHIVTDPPIADLPEIDFIFYATGARANFEELPLLQPLQKSHPVRFQDGLPCVTEDLQWNSDVPLGPGAANLEGARMGAERIVPRVQEILEELAAGTAENRRVPDVMRDLREKYALGSTHLNMYAALEEDPAAADHVTRRAMEESNDHACCAS